MGYDNDHLLLMGDGVMELFLKNGKKLVIPEEIKRYYANQKEFWWKPGKH